MYAFGVTKFCVAFAFCDTDLLTCRPLSYQNNSQPKMFAARIILLAAMSAVLNKASPVSNTRVAA